METRSYIGSTTVPLRLVFFMWLVFTIEFYFSINLSGFGIIPVLGCVMESGTVNLFGIIGIVTSPLLHGNLPHLASNTIPLLFLGCTLFYFYNRIGTVVLLRCYFVTNVLVWLFSPRCSVHIGASGLIYGLSAFLIFFGLLRRDMMSFLISIVVILLYGGIFYGVFPTSPWISWESHLAGTIVGATTAFSLRNTKRV